MRVLVLLALLLFASAVEPLHAAETVAGDPQRATIAIVLDLGTALYSWLVDHPGDHPWPARLAGELAPASVRWSSCPILSHDEATRLLVPRYLTAVARTDGWGNELQLCLDRERVGVVAHPIIGIRSLGSDHHADGDEYTAGVFVPAATARDVVWLDGYFVSWPHHR